MRVRVNASLAAILGAAMLVAGCGGGGSSPSSAPGSASNPPAASRSNVSLDKNAYPVFPSVDAGADPAVPAEQGGKGFTGEEWDTSKDFDLIGDPRAVKGGALRTFTLSFPGTLRMAGPEWNTDVNYAISQLAYETLLSLHPTTLAWMPLIASHWQIAPDKMTFRFRIDPNAKFSDGTAVTAEDVVASWSFHADKALQDAFFYTEFNRLEKPVAESKYIVRIKAKEQKWTNFLTAAGIRVFPAHVLKNLNGETYLRDYNFKLLPGTGPYTVTEADVKKGASVSLRRRPDYWGKDYRANVGQYNFDEFRFVVVRDENLAFEMFKKGDLDFHNVRISRQWIEDLNYDDIQRGIIVKRKVFNNYPSTNQWFAFNTRRQPWDDIRVRKALALLFNRQQLIKTLFFNEYLPLNSFFPGTVYENPNNPQNEYNPQEALKLLADAGWKARDAQGRLVRNGKPLIVEVLYGDKNSERWMTVYQEDLRKVGIGMNLRLVNPETRFKMQMQRQFEITSSAWGAGSIFPTVRDSFHSSMADQLNTNNITGYKIKRLDEICDLYETEFDQNKRTALLRELDGIVMTELHYLMEWYAPSSRLAYWNRFGIPQGTLSRIGDEIGSLAPGAPQLWWIDPQKSAQVDRGLKDKSMKFEIPPIEDHYWQNYGK